MAAFLLLQIDEGARRQFRTALSALGNIQRISTMADDLYKINTTDQSHEDRVQ